MKKAIERYRKTDGCTVCKKEIPDYDLCQDCGGTFMNHSTTWNWIVKERWECNMDAKWWQFWNKGKWVIVSQGKDRV